MEIYTQSGKFDTEKVAEMASKEARALEVDSRENPANVNTHNIGYIIPLGALDSNIGEFSSKFILIAYNIAKEFSTNMNDFEELNGSPKELEAAAITRLTQELSNRVEQTLGKGWKIAMFNSNIQEAVSARTRRPGDDAMSEALCSIKHFVEQSIDGLSKTSEEKPWRHEIVNLFYGDCDVLESTFKISNAEDKDGEHQVDVSMLVYDNYANGLRILSNRESFATTRIRQHKTGKDKIWAYVLKARTPLDKPEYRPIRQFDGTSIVTTQDVSGITLRIIYHLVNKNYNKWNFLSLPEGNSRLYKIEIVKGNQ